MRVSASLVSIALLLFASSACTGGDGPAPSPTAADAPLIVYEADTGDATNVFTIDAQSREVTQLTTSVDGYDGNPAWSPDHNRIVFVSNRDRGGRNNDVYTMAADGSDVQRITKGTSEQFWSPRYSPDGRSIAYMWAQQGDFYVGVMRTDGQAGRRVAGPVKFAEFPSWSPDGKEIYFAAIGEGTQAADILAVNVETTDVRTVISTPSADACPHFTRDGKYLTYASAPRDDVDGEPDMFKHDLASTDTSGASDAPFIVSNGRDDYGTPSPDGSTYVFISSRDSNSELYLADADGKNQRRLTDTPKIRENVPDW